jgi:S-adenosylmethionine:tRNA ribosyltransferase-isomerase
MHINELDYPLPESLIAAQPVEPRESCRLMVIDRASQTIEHKKFTDLPGYLRPGDLLVLNTAKVTPARMYAKCEELPDREFEVLVIEHFHQSRTIALLNPSRRIRVGMKLYGIETKVTIEVLREVGEGQWEIGLSDSSLNWRSVLEKEGHLALPPYILKLRSTQSDVPQDKEWYQTAFSDRDGAIAAPTAGLHFSKSMLEDMEKRGIEIARVFLRVGIGTFQPIRTDEIEEHRMLAEEFEVNAAAANQILKAHERRTRIIAVGTTVVRTLEYLAKAGNVRASQGSSDLFIKPPFDFKIVNSLITNFHLPKTTLLALVYAFGGTDLLKKAYEEAVREKYRFFSYGDAMLIL